MSVFAVRWLKSRIAQSIASVAVVPTAAGSIALAAQDKYAVQVPNGLSLAECKGYEDWPTVSVSQPEGKLDVIVANPTMIDAYRAGVPGNGKPFPDGSRMMKVIWNSKQSTDAPAPTKVPDTLSGVGCMVKDSKRFADTGGWGWAQFDYDSASGTLKPNTTMQGNDAKCGFACHTIVAKKDYVFTEYGRR
jgi:hypothetical protein